MEGGDVRHARVDELAVHLVAEQEEVVLLDDIAQALHLLAGVEVARRVVGVADEDGLGARGDLLLEGLHGGQAEAVLDVGLDALDHGAHGDGEGHVVGVERIRDDHFVARPEAPEEGEQHRLGAAGGDDDLLRRKINPVLSVVLHHLGAQREVAVGRAVLQDAAIHGLEGVETALRGLDVRLADIEVIDVYAVALGRVGVRSQLPDRGRRHVLSSLRDFHNSANIHKKTRFAGLSRRMTYKILGFRVKPGMTIVHSHDGLRSGIYSPGW